MGGGREEKENQTKAYWTRNRIKWWNVNKWFDVGLGGVGKRGKAVSSFFVWSVLKKGDRQRVNRKKWSWAFYVWFREGCYVIILFSEFSCVQKSFFQEHQSHFYVFPFAIVVETTTTTAKTKMKKAKDFFSSCYLQVYLSRIDIKRLKLM